MTIQVPIWRESFERARTACANHKFKDAEAFLKEALGLARSTPDGEADTGQILFSLGWTYHARAQTNDAEQAYLQALNVFERFNNPNSRKAGEVLHNLGALYSEMGRTSEARPFLIRSLEI